MHDSIDNPARKNYLLAAMPFREFEQVSPVLEQVSLTTGQVLHQSGEKFDYVYFPTTAVVALLYLSRTGTTVGVGLIGREGVVGIDVIMGVHSAPSVAVVQNSGTAFRIRASEIRAKCAVAPACRNAAFRYTQALLTQLSQTAVCNRLHPVSQRYARWLLDSADRLDTNRLAMTQKQIAHSLGTRREGITKAGQKLAALGLIKLDRGAVTIIDRPGLELTACECYEVVSSEYDRLLGPTPREHSANIDTTRHRQVQSV